MSQNNYVIYKFTSPSGKSYIGQTNNLKERIRTHKRNYSNCTAFLSAIKRYGFENFTQEILKENLTLNEANQWEEFYIREHNTISPSGYNLKTGGDCTKLSQETKDKISKKLTGIPRPDELREKLRLANTGKKQSPETIAKRVSKLIGKSSWNKGKQDTDETKRKKSESQKGRKIPQEVIEKRKVTYARNKAEKLAQQQISIF